MVNFQYLKGTFKKAGEGFLIKECRDKTKVYSSKLKQCRFELDVRRKFFAWNVVRHWDMLSVKVQGQVGLGFDPIHGRRIRNR